MIISIITINYNNRSGLEKTITSVLAQSYVDIEYIIIDGGSQDGSKDLIKKYDAHINYWVSERDTGIYNAMNKGIKVATGDYLMFINSGDRLYDGNVIERLLNGIKPEMNYELIYGDLKMSYPDGTTFISKSPEEATIETMMTGTLFHPATLIKKKLFNQFGLYDERFKIVSDWAFFFKVIAFYNVKQVYKPLVVAEFFMDGISSKPENRILIDSEKEIVINEMFSQKLITILEEYPRLKRFYNFYGMAFIRYTINLLKKMKHIFQT